MARKTDDLKIAQVKRAYLAGEGTLSALALRFGLGERTLKRFSAEGNWEALKLARETVVTQTVRDRVSMGPTEFNPDELLRAAIMDLAAALPECQVKSKESGAAAMSRLIEVWRRFNPLSMEELVQLALNTPNFSPREFVRILKERIDQNSTG